MNQPHDKTTLEFLRSPSAASLRIGACARVGFLRGVALQRRTLGAAALAASAITGWAQPLPVLYQQALQSDPAVQAARAATQAALARAGQAEALRKPAVGLKLDFGLNQAQDTLLVPDRTSVRSGQMALQVQQSLYNRAEAQGVSAAQAQVAAVRRQEVTVEHELQWRLVQAYVELLASRGAATVQMQFRASLGSQLAGVQASLLAGNATTVDFHETQARLDLAQMQERAAVAEVRNKQAALDALAGTSQAVPRPWALIDRIAIEPAGGVEDWIASAQAGADAVLQTNASLEVARWSTQRARADFLPTVVLNASLGVGSQQQSASFGGDIGSLRRNGNNRVASLGLSVNVPIDASAVIEQRVSESIALEARARAEWEASRRNSASAVEQAWLGLLSLQEQIRGTEAAERSSAQAMEASERSVAAGVRVRLDLLTAQAQLYAIRRDLVRLRHEAALSWLRLKHLSGSLSIDGM